MEIGRIDVDGVDTVGTSDPACGTHAEPPRSGTDIGNRGLGVNPQQVHYPVDLQLLISFGALEDRKVPCIRLASGPVDDIGALWLERL